MRAGVAGQQPVEGAGRRSQERLRYADRRRHADAVAVSRDILDGDPAVVAGDPHPDRAPSARQLGEPGIGRRAVLEDARGDLVVRQVAQAPQQVVHLVDGGRLPIVGQRLQRQLQVGQRVRVEQLAQLLLAEELAEQVAVEGERARAALGERRVAVVHVRRDVVEQEAAREWARPRRLDAVDRDLAARDATQDVAQRVEVEDVRQALAVRLDEDREAAVPTGHGQQIGGTLALLPEGRPCPRPAPGEEQRPRRVLAEPAGEQRRVRDLADDQVLDVLRGREQQVLDPVHAPLPFGKTDRDAVVGPDGLDLDAEAVGEPRLDRQRPRGVDSATERCQQRQAPVAELVAEPLDHDPLVGRERAGRFALVLEIREQVLGGAVVEIVVVLESLRGGGPTLGRRDRGRLRSRRRRRPARDPARSGDRRRRPSRTGACRARPAPA